MLGEYDQYLMNLHEEAFAAAMFDPEEDEEDDPALD